MGLVATMESHLTGHRIYWDLRDQVWRYADDHSETDPKDPRDCSLCGRNPSDFGGHDPCIANLPGVKYACCGHGVRTGYVKFTDGRTIDGHFTEKEQGDGTDDEG